MLLRFGVQNHQSIRAYEEISFVASTLKDDDRGLLSLAKGKDSDARIRALPVVALYGANASGKSTLLHAFHFFVGGIVASHTKRSASDRVPYAPFLLDEESRGQPSRYDADFVVDGLRYHYGYTVNEERIQSEWLYSFPLSGVRQARTVLFHRDPSNEDEFYFGPSLKGENKLIARIVRPNSLFLSAAAQNAHAQLTPIYKFFAEKITKRFGEPNTLLLPEQLMTYFGEDKVRRDAALGFLNSADVGIVGIDFSKVPIEEKVTKFAADFEQLMISFIGDKEQVPKFNRTEQAKVDLMHKGAGGRSYPIPISDESAGTISLLELLGPILSRLSEGGVLVIDELNSTLHPIVSRALISLFSTPETNPGKAQLIFSTHDTNLLAGRLLRRDQIWFAEKDDEGATHIYSMSEIKVRATDNLETGYLRGKFGAIPCLGKDLMELVAESQLGS